MQHIEPLLWLSLSLFSILQSEVIYIRYQASSSLTGIVKWLLAPGYSYMYSAVVWSEHQQKLTQIDCQPTRYLPILAWLQRLLVNQFHVGLKNKPWFPTIEEREMGREGFRERVREREGAWEREKITPGRSYLLWLNMVIVVSVTHSSTLLDTAYLDFTSSGSAGQGKRLKRVGRKLASLGAGGNSIHATGEPGMAIGWN